MTDPFSAPRRQRRRSGRHQQPARRPQSSPLPPDEARKNRDAAFGTPNPRRTWLGTSSASADPAPTAPSADRAPSASAEPRTERLSTAAQEPAERRPRGRRAAFPLEDLDTSGAPAGAADDGTDPAGPASDVEAGEHTHARRGTADSNSAERVPLEPAAPAASAAAAGSADQDVWSTTHSDESTPTASSAPLAPPRGSAPVDPAATKDDDARPEPRPTAAAGSTAPPAGSDDFSARAPIAAAAVGTGGAGAGSGSGSGSGDDRSSESADAASGSLPKVAFWTVLTSVLPGSGLLTTRMRRYGVVMLAILLLAVVLVVAFLQIGDPLRTGMMLVSRRGILIGALVVTVVVGLLWALQIVLANLAHTNRQRLEGAKRYVALALAALMVVAVAVPFGRGVQSLWALQGLVGSESVFGGGEGGDHPFGTGKDPWANTERVNIMMLGQDAGADRTGTRPDTIMVASVDTATGQTALFSIPRNLERVRFPKGTVAAKEFPDGFDYYGKNENLINAVWAWAEENPDLFPNDPEPGLTATRWAVEETLGLKTDYYAMVNLQGFEDLVDALGGVDMVVERRIPIGGGAAKIDGYIEPGEQKLDGFHALWYARSREGSDDFNRMCRQQRMVRAVSEEADPTTLALSVPKLVNATEENIQTDIPVSNLDAFVDLALRIKEGGFTSYPITQDVTFSGRPDWPYLKTWVDASIKDSMKNNPPESVLGETEPGSTEPAETGAAPDEETSSSATATPTEKPTTEESTAPSESSSASASSSAEATPTKAPEIEKDPLKSCLPGYEG